MANIVVTCGSNGDRSRANTVWVRTGKVQFVTTQWLGYDRKCLIRDNTVQSVTTQWLGYDKKGPICDDTAIGL